MNSLASDPCKISPSVSGGGNMGAIQSSPSQQDLVRSGLQTSRMKVDLEGPLALLPSSSPCFCSGVRRPLSVCGGSHGRAMSFLFREPPACRSRVYMAILLQEAVEASRYIQDIYNTSKSNSGSPRANHETHMRESTNKNMGDGKILT